MVRPGRSLLGKEPFPKRTQGWGKIAYVWPEGNESMRRNASVNRVTMREAQGLSCVVFQCAKKSRMTAAISFAWVSSAK